MEAFSIKEEFAVSVSKVPTSCLHCKRYTPKMWTRIKTKDEEKVHSPRRINSWMYSEVPRSESHYRCLNCVFGNRGGYTNDWLKKNHLKFLYVGNIFKCPDKLCDRQNLSFQEFYSKSCCKSIIGASSLDFKESAIVDHGFVQRISQLHMKSGVLKRSAQLKFEDAKKKMEEAEKELNDREEDFQKIEERMALYFARTATNISKGKAVEEDRRLFCQICREKYNDDDRVQCVLLCRHSACENCLKTLPAKNCPSCRNPFTDDQIIKLCY